MSFIDTDPNEGMATQQINKKFQSAQIIQANATGFGAASDDFMERGIDLNEQLIRNKPATFFFRVNSDAMLGAGIHVGDILIVDRSLEPQNNKIAVCFIDGEFTVKRIQVEDDCLYLMPENPSYQPIKVTEESELVIWGMVTYVIKNL